MYCFTNKIIQTDSLCGAGSLLVFPDVHPKVINLDGVILSYQELLK